MLKTIFFGTPEYSIYVAEKLLKNTILKAVVTQPAKPVGRKKILTPSPVHLWAQKHKIPIIFTHNDILKIKADLGVVAAYGKLLEGKIIKHFKYGILNLHPSLLPAWRGPAPVEASIIEGKHAGVTIIKMDSKMDHGPIVTQRKISLPKKDAGELKKELFAQGARMLEKILPKIKNLNSQPQNHKKATFTTYLTKQDGFIPPKYLKKALTGTPSQDLWQIRFMSNYAIKPSSQNLARFIKAMAPWPGAWTFVKLDGKAKRLKILKAEQKRNKLVIKTVQLEGKKRVDWKTFCQGYPNFKFTTKPKEAN